MLDGTYLSRNFATLRTLDHSRHVFSILRSGCSMIQGSVGEFLGFQTAWSQPLFPCALSGCDLLISGLSIHYGTFPGCWKRFIMLLQQRPLPRMDSSSWLVCPVAWFRITATGRHISHESINCKIWCWTRRCMSGQTWRWTSEDSCI